VSTKLPNPHKTARESITPQPERLAIVLRRFARRGRELRQAKLGCENGGSTADEARTRTGPQLTAEGVPNGNAA